MSDPAPLTPAAQELLDGFREMVAEWGVPINFAGNPAGTYQGLLVFPTAGDDTDRVGFQGTALDGVELERAFFTAAGVGQTSRFTVGANPQLLHVTGIEDDGVSPVVYFSAEEVQ